MANNENKYYAFLSYSPQDNREHHADSPPADRRRWGNWLDDALKAFTIPPEFVGQINGRGEIIPERIAPVFRDESELPEDSSLSAETRQALDQSICLIVICSPHSAQSRQVNEVVRYFKQLGRGKQILPIVVAGEPNAGTGNNSGVSPADECFIPALRHPVQPDGTMDTARRSGKHIFVDARHGVEKREILAKDHRNAEADLEMAKIQLIALLIGVGFNGLWWREQKRHFFDFAEAQHQAREALNQVEEIRRQLQEAQRQIRETQRQALELQNLPSDVQGRIQEAQNQAHEAQTQVREAQQQLQEFGNKVRDYQSQLEEARQRAVAAESKVRETQQQAREAQTQLEKTRKQVREAQNAQNQSEEIRHQAQAVGDQFLSAQSQIQEFQNQARSAQGQLEEAREQIREAQGKFLEAQNQARAAQEQVREIQNRTENAQNQIAAAQNQKIQSRDWNARRLTKVFALLAALALMAAGMVANQAWRQHQAASQALAKATAEAAGTFDLPSGGGAPIRQWLQKIGGAEQDENRRSSLDRLAASIPPGEIPEVLKAASVIVDDQQRSHFQKWLLVRLGRVNPLSAMTNASAIEGKIVNDKGLSDSGLYFQLAVLGNWTKTDWPGAFNWVCQLPDADSRHRALDEINRLVQSQPDSEAKNQALANCLGELAKTDVPGAMALAESLPDAAWRSPLIASQWMQIDPFAIWDWINLTVLPPEIMSPRKTSWPWTKSFSNANFGHPALLPATPKLLSTATNVPVSVQPQE